MPTTGNETLAGNAIVACRTVAAVFFDLRMEVDFCFMIQFSVSALLRLDNASIRLITIAIN
jgi:hypothetical protein